MSTLRPPDVIHMIGVPRPSPFFTLFCFRGSGPQAFACVTSCRAACTLPSIISLARSLAVRSSFFCDCWLRVSCRWIVEPSCIRSFSFPSNQRFRQHSRWRESSLAFDLELGFCKKQSRNRDCSLHGIYAIKSFINICLGVLFALNRPQTTSHNLLERRHSSDGCKLIAEVGYHFSYIFVHYWVHTHKGTWKCRLPLQITNGKWLFWTVPQSNVIVSMIQKSRLTSLPISAEEIKKATDNDHILQKVIGKMKKGWLKMRKNVSKELQPYFNQRFQLSLQSRCLLCGQGVRTRANRDPWRTYQYSSYKSSCQSACMVAEHWSRSWKLCLRMWWLAEKFKKSSKGPTTIVGTTTKAMETPAHWLCWTFLWFNVVDFYWCTKQMAGSDTDEEHYSK